jgi:putative spermidine/putrescine transport system permease protein
MHIASWVRLLFAAFAACALAVLYAPIAVIAINSFSSSANMTWPPPGLTMTWWCKALVNRGALDAIGTSIMIALCSTAIALLLGTLAALALQQSRFFGRRQLNLLIVMPIALPGIVTGLALNNGFKVILGVPLGVLTVVAAHATFCIVVVYNNVAARVRSTGTRPEEASQDLGAGTFTTFRLITLPNLRSALVAGALLAFALSFDEIIVTTFTAGPGTTTLPIWILQNMFRPSQAPIVAVVAVVLILIATVPLIVAQRLTRNDVQ